MAFFKRQMPSVNALVTLEAAVRLNSFTAAARELNVTQAAVSRQIHALEAEFGQSLFVRRHRRVEPTEAGALLGSTVTGALDQVADAVERIRAPPARSVTIGATLAMSYFWLMPRLSLFRSLHPGVALRVVSQDEPLLLGSGEVDVLVRFGEPPFADGVSVAACEAEVFPVCAPALARSCGQLANSADILDMPLIEHAGSDPTWLRWADWSERAGLGRRSPPIALHFNRYADAMAAAVAGEGVALGWNLISRDAIERGQLRPLGQRVRVTARYNAMRPHRRSNNPAADDFVAWLADRFDEEMSGRLLA